MATSTIPATVAIQGKHLYEVYLEERLAVTTSSYRRVVSGTNLTTGKKVAVKMFDTRNIDEFRLERINDELELLKFLQAAAPSMVIPLLEIIEQDKLVFVIMEHGREDLLNYLQSVGGLSNLKDAQKIFAQMVKAVDFLHNIGIVHGDIKLENFLIDRHTLEIKLIDYGSSILMNFSKDGEKPSSPPEKKLIRRVYGTTEYMSPEMHRNEFHDPFPSELYSLGVVLHTLLLNCLPCADSMMIIHELYDSNSPWNDLLGLLIRMLAEDSASRPTLEQIKKHPWIVSYFDKTAPAPASLSASDGKITNNTKILDIKPNSDNPSRSRIPHLTMAVSDTGLKSAFSQLYFNMKVGTCTKVSPRAEAAE